MLRDAWTDRGLAGSIGIRGSGRSDPGPGGASGSSARQHYDDGACRWGCRSSATFANTASGGSRRSAVVVVQEAAEAFAMLDQRCRIGVVVGRHDDRRDQPVVEALVVALAVVGLDELGDREPEVALTERNELVEALGLEREHEAFCDGIQVSCSPGS